MFIEIHILQNFAPSNLNRDDTGNPKDTEFGGVRRARISSQCIKRSIRMHPVFAKSTQVDIATRTRWITRLLTDALMQAGKPAEQARAVAEAYATQYSKLDKDHTAVLLYLSASELQEAIEGLTGGWEDVVAGVKDKKQTAVKQLAEKMFKSLKGRTSAPDIALFGRMLAEKPDLNIDAACQVAHAISTHRANMEIDFYTAVDDLSTDEGMGAGMMGVVAFNSACFYRYARIDWEQLCQNLDRDVELARKTVSGFLKAAALAVPTGKQNSFAAQNPPDFLLGVLRDDGQSWSLANAFEKPVRQERDGGLMNASIAALDSYWGKLVHAYGGRGVTPVVLAVPPDPPLTELKDAVVSNLDEWVTTVLSGLPDGS